MVVGIPFHRLIRYLNSQFNGDGKTFGIAKVDPLGFCSCNQRYSAVIIFDNDRTSDLLPSALGHTSLMLRNGNHHAAFHVSAIVNKLVEDPKLSRSPGVERALFRVRDCQSL